MPNSMQMFIVYLKFVVLYFTYYCKQEPGQLKLIMLLPADKNDKKLYFTRTFNQ